MSRPRKGTIELAMSRRKGTLELDLRGKPVPSPGEILNVSVEGRRVRAEIRAIRSYPSPITRSAGLIKMTATHAVDFIVR